MEWLFLSLAELGLWVETKDDENKVLVMLPLGDAVEILVGSGSQNDYYHYRCKVARRVNFLATIVNCERYRMTTTADQWTLWQYDRDNDYQKLPAVILRLNDEDRGLLVEVQHSTTLYMGILHRKNAMGGPWRIGKDMVRLMGRIHYTLGLERVKSLL